MSKLGQLLVTFFAIQLAILAEGVPPLATARPYPARWPCSLPHPSTLAFVAATAGTLLAIAYPTRSRPA